MLVKKISSSYTVDGSMVTNKQEYYMKIISIIYNHHKCGEVHKLSIGGCTRYRAYIVVPRGIISELFNSEATAAQYVRLVADQYGLCGGDQ